jgi:endonuclease YncB( thermonuclease family)
LVIICAIAIFLASFATSFASEHEIGDKICGLAKIVDGDDLLVGDIPFRLFGIDAYEEAQECRRQDGRLLDLGVATLAAIKELASDKLVCCVVDHWIRGRGQRRPVGRCTVNAVDVSEYMVSAGYAVDCPRFSLGRYSAAETSAQDGLRGGWACLPIPEKPWDFKKTANYCAPR